jgi:hypothetical protein
VAPPVRFGIVYRPKPKIGSSGIVVAEILCHWFYSYFLHSETVLEHSETVLEHSETVPVNEGTCWDVVDIRAKYRGSSFLDQVIDLNRYIRFKYA